MNGKQFIMTTMFAMVLLTMAFIPISSQQTGTYDPWLDVDDNGKIEIKDFALMAKAYGATGDPTKNVNVTNWPIDQQGNLKVTVGTWAVITLVKDRYVSGITRTRYLLAERVSVSGYSRMYLYLSFKNWTGTQFEIDARASFLIDGIIGPPYQHIWDNGGLEPYSGVPKNYTGDLRYPEKTWIAGPEARIYVDIIVESALISASLFLTTE